MTRGSGEQTKVCYKGKSDDYIVFVESPQDLNNWLKDKSIPLAQVVNSFKIFVTHKQGAQGMMDEASKSQLQNDFGTSDETEIIKKILEGGTSQVGVSSERQGNTNMSIGSMGGH